MKERKTPWWFKKREDGPAARVKRDYTIISSVDRGIISLLKEHMVPDVISGSEQIGLCAPGENGDILLGIYLYDIRENEEMRVGGMLSYDEEQLQNPPMYLSLYYMITAYGDMDIRYREEENHRLLAKAMQVFGDYPVLDSATLYPTGEIEPYDLHIEFLSLKPDEKAAVWQNARQPVRLSLFYRITPVQLDSTIRKRITRVKEIKLMAP